MNRLTLSLAALSMIAGIGAPGLVPLVMAADLPAKPLVKAPVAVAPSPFYIFAHGGAGFTNIQNDIALPGVATGTPKLWPAGFMVGGGLGYLSSIGPLSVGLEAEGNYDFTRASLTNVVTTGDIGVMGKVDSKNSWFFAEKALVGITISQLTGYIPGAAQPANWPVPITVPAGFAQNLMLLGVVGAAQRNVDLCATDINMNTFCGSQWKNGLLFGAQARAAISQNVSLRVEYDYIMFNQTFTAANVVEKLGPIFANTVAAKDEQRVMAGFNYNF
jgi:opacity protein-like surface antigen